MKKIISDILYPHISLPLLLTPISVLLLVYSFSSLEQSSAVSIVSYVLSAYTLTLWCVRIPKIILWSKRIKKDNKLIARYFNDVRFRVNISLTSGCLFNLAYAVFQFFLGMYHRSFWFVSFSVYYLLLSVMKFGLVRYTARYSVGQIPELELKKHRSCALTLLLLALPLMLIVFFMVYWGREIEHHYITSIAMAAYTFVALGASIISTARYRKYKSPVLSASKALSLASASVSLITLSSTMLSTFGDDGDTLFKKIILSALGLAVTVFISALAVKMLNKAKNKENWR